MGHKKIENIRDHIKLVNELKKESKSKLKKPKNKNDK
jgi:hypothetical protein|tara:strand:+ start:1390 stop:1500 length:111 start_codon:yes stop_codon:yes gene_type:complete